MKFNNINSEFFIPSDADEKTAFKQTTHLAISAHQDDIEFMAYHGILECFNQKDKGFSAVVITDGAGSPRAGVYKDYTDSEMQAVRRTEQKLAAQIGGYKLLSLLDYPSSEVKQKNQNVINDLVSIIKAAKPKIIYTHNLADKHDTHVAVALKVIAAIRALPKSERPKTLLGCEVWRGLDWLDDNEKVMLNCADKPNLSAALTGVFDSQISGGKRYDEAVLGRRKANATFCASHGVDEYSEVTYAMDLTPLIEDDKKDITSFITSKIDNLKNEVALTLNKYL